MNITAELVKEWAEFETTHPTAGIADFCRYYLTVNNQNEQTTKFLGGHVPPSSQSTMAKLIARINRLFMTYSIKGLKEIGISNFDDFTYLSYIKNLDRPSKTEVIIQNLQEFSSGLLVIERLKKNGYITENDDLKDKRSKVLSITPKGEQKLKEGFGIMRQVSELFFHDIPEDDLQLCFHLLSPIDSKFAGLWQMQKGLTLKDIYEEITHR